MDERDIRTRLEQEKSRLVDMQGGLTRQHGDRAPEPSAGELTTYDQHDADLATETFEREKDESILARLDTELAQVDRALEKLGAGSYGVCEACGRHIGEDRLEAFPAARYCVEDQVRAEEEASGG